MKSGVACKQFSQHPERKICFNCFFLKQDHGIDSEDVSELQNVLKEISENKGIVTPPTSSVYSWVPPDCPQNRYDDFFKNFSDEQVPKKKTEGEKHRLKQLYSQIPLCDVSEKHSRFVELECTADFKTHIQNMTEKSMQFGYVKEWKRGMSLQCPECLLMLDSDDIVVFSSTSVYHPACFTCIKCKETPIDLIHCSDEDGNNYCIRHYSETLRKRCHECDELIFALQYVQALDKFFHQHHVFCFNPGCDGLLEDKGFERGGEMYCFTCYEANFTSICQKCERKIAIDSKYASYEDKCWHLECFVCETCRETLSDFVVVEDKYCCVNCYNEFNAPRCKYCKELFEGQERVIKYEDSTYHINCFRCCNCDKVIGTDSFVTHNSKVYCKQCNVRLFGVKCFKCRHAITDDYGVMYNKQPYHASCFICHSCKDELANEPFKAMDGKWYCLTCFGRTFCKECQACGQPIRLAGENDVFYSHGKYQWHSQCFMCQTCGRSLANIAFNMHSSKLFCKVCMKGEDIPDLKNDTSNL